MYTYIYICMYIYSHIYTYIRKIYLHMCACHSRRSLLNICPQQRIPKTMQTPKPFFCLSVPEQVSDAAAPVQVKILKSQLYNHFI